MTLTTDEQEKLLALAREAIEQSLNRQELVPLDLDTVSENLRRGGASFVTLTRFGELRGCIGSLEPRRPLVVDVRENAVGAAFNDPRFPPLRAEELDILRIEISVLSVPQLLPYEDADDLIAKLRPGIDGLVIEQGWNRATFLPQVWEKLPDAHQFLERLCLKAYLPADAYRRPGLDVYTYQVTKFEEAE